MSAPGFWARRKAAVEAEARQDADRTALQEAEAREADLADLSDSELLERLELPDPETLSAGDDFKVFLTETVPARIRSRALRRLWLTNPVLANVDGLVDYGEDFTDASLVVENLQTAYQVGKGMTRHVMELERQAAEKQHSDGGAAAETPEDMASEADLEPIAEPEVVQAVPPIAAATADNAPITDPVPVLAPDTEDQTVAQRVPRMRFSFDPEQAAT